MLSGEQRDQIFSLIELPEMAHLEISTSKKTGDGATMYAKTNADVFVIFSEIEKIFPGLMLKKSNEYDLEDGARHCIEYRAHVAKDEIKVCSYTKEKAPAPMEGDEEVKIVQLTINIPESGGNDDNAN